MEIEEKTSDAKLRIENIRTSDEGEYKCEITFLDITKNCPVVQLVKLTTLGKLNFLIFTMHNKILKIVTVMSRIS